MRRVKPSEEGPADAVYDDASDAARVEGFEGPRDGLGILFREAIKARSVKQPITTLAETLVACISSYFVFWTPGDANFRDVMIIHAVIYEYRNLANRYVEWVPSARRSESDG